MNMSPEERRRIYEEEKAKIDAGQKARAEKDKGYIPPDTSINLTPRISGFLCYLGVWVTGIIFFILEQKNRWVRFHAAQSIVVFGSLMIASGLLTWIPFIGDFFKAVLTILGIVLWIVLMVKAYNGERYRVPWAADIAEMMIGQTGSTPASPAPPAGAQPAGPASGAVALVTPPPAEGAQTAPPPPPPPPGAPEFREVDEKTNRKINDWFSHRREGRITGSAFAIAFSIIVLIFFNFFNQYIAYYTGDTVNGVISWTREPFFTNDIKLWLPILNTSLAVTIISHIIMIIVDNDLLRKALHVIMDGFGLAVVVTLLYIFPLNFDVLPNNAAATGTNLGVHVVLILVAVGIGIGLLVKLIQLLVSIGKALVKSV